MDFMNLNHLNNGVAGFNVQPWDVDVVYEGFVKVNVLHPPFEIVIKGPYYTRRQNNIDSFVLPSGNYDKVYIQLYI